MPEFATTAAPNDLESPVDLYVLSRLLCIDDTDEIADILSIYWDTMAGTPEALKEFFDARDARALGDAAHAAKSASESIGATPAAALLKSLELAAAHQDWDQVVELIPGVDAAFHSIEAFIDSLHANE